MREPFFASKAEFLEQGLTNAEQYDVPGDEYCGICKELLTDACSGIRHTCTPMDVQGASRGSADSAEDADQDASIPRVVCLPCDHFFCYWGIRNFIAMGSRCPNSNRCPACRRLLFPIELDPDPARARGQRLPPLDFGEPLRLPRLDPFTPTQVEISDFEALLRQYDNLSVQEETSSFEGFLRQPPDTLENVSMDLEVRWERWRPSVGMQQMDSILALDQAQVAERATWRTIRDRRRDTRLSEEFRPASAPVQFTGSQYQDVRLALLRQEDPLHPEGYQLEQHEWFNHSLQHNTQSLLAYDSVDFADQREMPSQGDATHGALSPGFRRRLNALGLNHGHSHAHPPPPPQISPTDGPQDSNSPSPSTITVAGPFQDNLTRADFPLRYTSIESMRSNLYRFVRTMGDRMRETLHQIALLDAPIDLGLITMTPAHRYFRLNGLQSYYTQLQIYLNYCRQELHRLASLRQLSSRVRFRPGLHVEFEGLYSPLSESQERERPEELGISRPEREIESREAAELDTGHDRVQRRHRSASPWPVTEVVHIPQAEGEEQADRDAIISMWQRREEVQLRLDNFRVGNQVVSFDGAADQEHNEGGGRSDPPRVTELDGAQLSSATEPRHVVRPRSQSIQVLYPWTSDEYEAETEGDDAVNAAEDDGYNTD